MHRTTREGAGHRSLSLRGARSGRAPRGSRARKREYSLTQAGLSELQRWIAEPPTYGPERDVARLRTAYLDFGDRETAQQFFQAHLEHHQHWLELWQSMQASIESHEHETIAERLRRRPADEHERIVAWKAFAYDALIARAKVEIEWARAGLELADRLSCRRGRGEARCVCRYLYGDT